MAPKSPIVDNSLPLSLLAVATRPRPIKKSRYFGCAIILLRVERTPDDAD